MSEGSRAKNIALTLVLRQTPVAAGGSCNNVLGLSPTAEPPARAQHLSRLPHHVLIRNRYAAENSRSQKAGPEPSRAGPVHWVCSVSMIDRHPFVGDVSQRCVQIEKRGENAGPSCRLVRQCFQPSRRKRGESSGEGGDHLVDRPSVPSPSTIARHSRVSDMVSDTTAEWSWVCERPLVMIET